jgi:hypothetical protein
LLEGAMVSRHDDILSQYHLSTNLCVQTSDSDLGSLEENVSLIW